MKTFEDYMGKDSWWWFVPTHPCLKVNYLEKLYSKQQYKTFLREEKEVEEDEWDLNKKHYITELRKSNVEKRLFAVGVTVLAGVCLAIAFNKLPVQIMQTS